MFDRPIRESETNRLLIAGLLALVERRTRQATFVSHRFSRACQAARRGMERTSWKEPRYSDMADTLKVGNAPAVVLTIALVLTGLSHASAAVTVPSLVTVGGTGIERGVARLVCERRNSNLSMRARAVVLDIGKSAPRHEVLLAPAHVLPDDAGRIKKDCRILSGHRRPGRIAEFWLSKSGNAELGADWVVVVTRSALKGPVSRLRVGALSQTVLEQLLADETAVEVMLFSTRADQRDCRMLELLERRVFSHTCRGFDGLSGAPIVIGIDGEPVVIGVQIAKMMHPTDLQGPPFIGVGLAIDDAIAAAIQEAANHVQRR